MGRELRGRRLPARQDTRDVRRSAEAEPRRQSATGERPLCTLVLSSIAVTVMTVRVAAHEAGSQQTPEFAAEGGSLLQYSTVTPCH